MLRVHNLLPILAGVFCAGLAVAAPIAGAQDGVTVQEWLQFLHIFLFVFWLGPDVAAWIWSRKAVEAGAPAEMQAVSRQMMTRVEMISRASMSLMLTVGGLLSHYVGLEHPWWQMAGIVLLGPVWLLLILAGFFRDGTAFGATALRLETALRWVVIVTVPLSVAWSTLSGRLDVAPYVGSKLLLFAAVLLCWQLLRTGVPRSRLYLATVWTGLLVAALLGVLKPGAPEVDGLQAGQKEAPHMAGLPSLQVQAD
ncbi:MAG: hypothetical protein R3F27_10750 [Gammaproteobacteria bacterium]|nr:hypothetical protein [Gammaproteobacteria bacterium]